MQSNDTNVQTQEIYDTGKSHAKDSMFYVQSTTTMPIFGFSMWFSCYIPQTYFRPLSLCLALRRLSLCPALPSFTYFCWLSRFGTHMCVLVHFLFLPILLPLHYHNVLTTMFITIITMFLYIYQLVQGGEGWGYSCSPIFRVVTWIASLQAYSANLLSCYIVISMHVVWYLSSTYFQSYFLTTA